MIIPGRATSTEAGVYALLDLISNTKSDAYKAALDDLVKTRVAAEDAVTKANQIDTANRKAAADLKAQADTLNKAVADHVVAADALKSQREVHLADVAAYEETVKTATVKLAKRETDVKGREAAADARETKIAARESAIAPREAAADAKAAKADKIIKRANALATGE